MADIRFYHMERSGLDQVLPQLLGKALQGGHKIVVRCAHEAEAERLSAHLWSFDAASFLPHGSKKDGHGEAQPIWLTAENDVPNDAGVLVLTGGVEAEDTDQFEMVCDMLNGHDPQAVVAARARWKLYKEAGHDVTYWQQGDKGWEKKA